MSTCIHPFSPISRSMAFKSLLIVIVGCFSVLMCGDKSFGQRKADIGAEEALDTSGWRSFRNGGASRVSKETELPVRWSPTQGISWQMELPGYGQSTPVLFADKVIVTAVEGPQRNTNVVMCVDRKSGNEIWSIRQDSSRQGPSNYMYSRAAPTPVVDEECVYAFFESGDMIAARLSDGQKLWERDLKDEVGELQTNHGLGSSLAQTQEHLIVNLEHNGPSALLAIQKVSGKTGWKTERPSGSSWSSPVVMRRGEQTQVVVSSAGEVAGYDALNGARLWKVDGLVGNSVASPLVVGNRLFLGARKPEFGSIQAAAKSNLCLEFVDDEIAPQIVWRSERCIADYSSPVVCGDYLFLINGSGVLGCLNSQSGEELYRKRLGFECWATPIVNGDHVFIFGKNGSTAVVHAEREFSKVSENRLWNTAEPPTPETYREHFPRVASRNTHGSEGHGAVGARGSDSSDATASHSKEGAKKPGAGMLAGLLKRDSNGDGVLSDDEIPQRLASVMNNIDLDGNGSLEKNELEKMAESFAAKRKGTRQSSRDPIVYGVAADARGLLIRTGTRLYSIDCGQERDLNTSGGGK